eukprot:TRINITY_DN12211_c0_g5_i3.p1 TRINITY_DN12211_c0_g5~~TRINITY_DN12211_c0_g5_i3.p1  ORF type:complete len:929 (+),score=262.01 TRINITY_DN12211_c0_g5_i3:153-2939(+)
MAEPIVDSNPTDANNTSPPDFSSDLLAAMTAAASQGFAEGVSKAKRDESTIEPSQAATSAHSPEVGDGSDVGNCDGASTILDVPGIRALADDDDDDFDSSLSSSALLDQTSGSICVRRSVSKRQSTKRETSMWLSSVSRQSSTEEEAIALDLAEDLYKLSHNCVRCGLKTKRKARRKFCRLCKATVCPECYTSLLRKGAKEVMCTQCYILNKDFSNRRNNFFEAPIPLLAGWFFKRGQKRKTWQKRYWVLDTNGMLTYYTDKKLTDCRGTIPTELITAILPCTRDDGLKWPALELAPGEDVNDAQGNPLPVPELRVQFILPKLRYALVFEVEDDFRELIFAISRFAGLCIRCQRTCFPASLESSSESEPETEAYYLPQSGAVVHPGCLSCVGGEALVDRDDNAMEVYLFKKQIHCLRHATEALDGLTASRDATHAQRRATIVQAVKLNAVIPSTIERITRFTYRPRQAVLLEQVARAAAQAHRHYHGGLLDAVDNGSTDATSDDTPMPPQIQAFFEGLAECAKRTADVSRHMVMTPDAFRADNAIKHTFHLPSDRSVDMIEHMPKTFVCLRNRFGIKAANFVQSFSESPTIRCKLSGGSSGSDVMRTMDGLYIVKLVPRNERDVLLQMLPSYLAHVSDHPHTLLNRLCGLFEVKLSSSRTSAGKYRSFMVMENVAGRAGKLTIHKRWDLKGSHVNRETKSAKGVQKDLNLSRPFVISERARHNIHGQLSIDAAFLDEHNIMDYSLLVCEHRCSGPDCCKDRKPLEVSRHDEHGNPKITMDDILTYGVRSAPSPTDPDGSSVYYFGVIDILQRWNAKKKMENFVKTQLRGKDKEGISAVNADAYIVRFMGFANSIIMDPKRLEKERQLSEDAHARHVRQSMSLAPGLARSPPKAGGLRSPHTNRASRALAAIRGSHSDEPVDGEEAGEP